MRRDWNAAPYNGAMITFRFVDGGMEVLSQPSRDTPQSDERERNAGGKPKPQDRNKPQRTANRERVEEVGIYSKPHATIYTLPTYELRDGHVQYFFAVHIDDCAGTIRSTVKIEKDSGVILLPPRWVSAHYAKTRCLNNHGRAVGELEKLLKKHKELARAS
jgi:hypothetical protein